MESALTGGGLLWDDDDVNINRSWREVFGIYLSRYRQQSRG